MAEAEAKLPKGAADWAAPTEREIAAAAVVTRLAVAVATEWARGLGGALGGLLDAKATKSGG